PDPGRTHVRGNRQRLHDDHVHHTATGTVGAGGSRCPAVGLPARRRLRSAVAARAARPPPHTSGGTRQLSGLPSPTPVPGPLRLRRRRRQRLGRRFDLTRGVQLASVPCDVVWPREAQLDMLGIARNTEITTAFGLAPLLLRGTRRIALIHERLAWLLSDQTSLRLLEPPMPLQPINQLMLWTTRAEHGPGLQWLRSRIV